MEPVKGFLGRFLRRRLLEVEVQEGVRSNDLNRIFDWIPKVWQHLNKFLETHSSSDVTIGEKSTIYRMHLPHRSLSHLLRLCLW
jgi:neuron navigator 2